MRIPCVQDVIDALLEPAGMRIEPTADTLKFGRPHTEVTGIATAFMPTQAVLEEAAARGANLVIVHEGLWYSHHDGFESSLAEADDPVRRRKRQFLLDAGLAVFRLHDHIHRYEPDGITAALIGALGWDAHVREHRAAASIVELPSAVTARDVAELAKRALGLRGLRLTGRPDTPCRRIGVTVGYRGGSGTALPLFGRDGCDLVLCGEGPEWETPEYVRDAVQQGSAKALLTLGHAESEAIGMLRLAERLRAAFPDVPVHYLADAPVYEWI